MYVLTCGGEIEYECGSCGQMTDCDECNDGIDTYLSDDEKEIFDEYKTQLLKDRKLLEAMKC